MLEFFTCSKLETKFTRLVFLFLLKHIAQPSWFTGILFYVLNYVANSTSEHLHPLNFPLNIMTSLELKCWSKLIHE